MAAFSISMASRPGGQAALLVEADSVAVGPPCVRGVVPVMTVRREEMQMGLGVGTREAGAQAREVVQRGDVERARRVSCLG